MPSCKEPLVAQYSGRLTRITSISDLLVFIYCIGETKLVAEVNSGIRMTTQISVVIILKHVDVEIAQEYNFALGLKHFICGS